MELKDLANDIDNAKNNIKSAKDKISLAEQAIEDYLLNNDQFYVMLINFRKDVEKIDYSRRYDSTAYLQVVQKDMLAMIDAKISRYKSDKLNIERGLQPSSGKLMVMGEVVSPIEFKNGTFQLK